MLTNYKYNLNFNLILDIPPEKQGVRQNWTLTKDGVQSVSFKFTDENGLIATIVNCHKKEMMGLAIEGYMGALGEAAYGYNEGYPAHLNKMNDGHWELEINE